MVRLRREILVPHAHTRTQFGLPLALGWLLVVAVRLIARLLAAGPGRRGWLGLMMLTALVSSFWLVAPVAIVWLDAWLRRVERSGVGRVGHHIALMAGCLVAEPAWYRIALSLAGGHPSPLMIAIIERADWNAGLYVLVLILQALSHRQDMVAARRRDTTRLEASRAQAELNGLTLQLRPHFLFNTLQMVAEMAYENGAAARATLADLRRLLVRSFLFDDKQLVPVEDEIDFLESYAAIQRQRFNGRVTLTIDVGRDLTRVLIPPLLFQPLVENALRHGIGPRACGGRVHVALWRDGERLRARVADDGIGLSGTVSDGRGLGLTRRRLDHLFGGDYELSLVSNGDHGADTVLSVPIRHLHGAPTARAAVHPDAADVVPRESNAALLALGAGAIALAAATLLLLRQVGLQAERDAIPAALRGLVVSLPIWGLMMVAGWKLGRWDDRSPGSRLAALVVTAIVLTGVHLVAAPLMADVLPGPTLPWRDYAMWAPADTVLFALVASVASTRKLGVEVTALTASAAHMEDELDRTQRRIASLKVHGGLLLGCLDAVAVAADPVRWDVTAVESADLIRVLLSAGDSGLVSVADELSIARRYVAIQAAARGGSTTVPVITTRIEPADATCALPGGVIAATVAVIVDTPGIRARSVNIRVAALPLITIVTVTARVDGHATSARVRAIGAHVSALADQLRLISGAHVALTPARAGRVCITLSMHRADVGSDRHLHSHRQQYARHPR